MKFLRFSMPMNLVSFIMCFYVFASCSAFDCNPMESCSECIKSDSSCAWCSQPDFAGVGRCKSLWEFESGASKCGKNHLIYPHNKLKILQNYPLGHQRDHTIHLQPQNIALELRAHEPIKFNLKFKQPENYPVDLYFLMDLSRSMKDDKDNVALLGNLIADSMMNITSDFRLGFGSFVDKTVLPFTDTAPYAMKHVCKNCSSPFTFINHLSLTSEVEAFAEQVNKAQVSGNIDQPEGVLDAIMQVIVCQKAIGWRLEARKLLVAVTDDYIHSAGDGKLAGIVIPNDSNCHLDENGYNAFANKQDYPSIHQINEKVKENKMNIIFAVPKDQVDAYNRITDLIDGATVGLLSSDSSNIVELINSEYQKIRSTVELKDDSSDFISLKYFSKCFSDDLMETNKCSGLKVGAEVDFEIEAQLLECPRDLEKLSDTQFSIYTFGLGATQINLKLLCSCECDLPQHQLIDSKFCSGSGTYKCGKCVCNPGKVGLKCQCDESDVGFENMTQCIRSEGEPACSGRGACECGVCKCYNSLGTGLRYKGAYCECDDSSCPRFQDLLCGGPSNGYCSCGKCICVNGHRGVACECPPSSICIHPNDYQICSGKGICGCNGCECNETEDGRRYTGTYCNIPPALRVTCEQMTPCVSCALKYFGSEDDSEVSLENLHSKCKMCHDQFQVHLNETIDHGSDVMTCQDKDDAECLLKYAYIYSGSVVHIYADKQPGC